MSYTAKVIEVVNGNTFRVDLAYSEVRLIDFHIPDPTGRGGELSKKELEKLILGKTVTVNKYQADTDGIELAKVSVGEVDIAISMNNLVQKFRNRFEIRQHVISYLDTKVILHGNSYENWYIGTSIVPTLACEALVTNHNVRLPERFMSGLVLKNTERLVDTVYGWSDGPEGGDLQEIVDYFIDDKGMQGRRVSEEEDLHEVYIYMIKPGTKQS